MQRPKFRAGLEQSNSSSALSRVAQAAFEALEGRTLFSTFTVTNGTDAAAGSLRAAIALADANAGADTINFATGVNTVTLTSGELSIGSDLSIAGPTSGTVTVARSAAPATPKFRVFETAINTTVQLSHLTITGGDAGIDDGGGVKAAGGLTLTSSTVTGNKANFGGGIAVSGASTTITACVISGNSSIFGGGIFCNGGGNLSVRSSTISDNKAGGGGGIFFESATDLLVESCTLSGNTASRSGAVGGGFFIKGSHSATVTSSTLSGNSALNGDGGGIYAETTPLTVTQCTLSGNSAAGVGGGISFSSTTLTVTSSTLTGNSASDGGGGIYGLSSDMTLTDTIVANSPTGGDLSDDSGFGTFSGSGNLIEDGTGGASLGKITGDPNLGPLLDNGGPTKTHALLGGIAIDAGVLVSGELEDQRGFARPIGAFDIGAVESGGSTASLVVTRADDVTDPNDGLTTLREAVNAANANPDASAITFAPGITTVTLTQGTLSLTTFVTISGPVGGTETITRAAAASNFGIFVVDFFGSANLSNLTITKGRTDDTINNLGGGIRNFGALRVNASTITDNTGGGLAAGGITNEGTLTVVASTISNNSATFGGGISSGVLNTERAIAKIVNSTISGNTASQGGGIYNGNFTDLSFTIRSSTIAGNGATEGGGIYYADAFDHMGLDNTIVADSTSGGDLGTAGGAFIGDGNLVEDGTGGTSLGKITGDPKLGPLADNGGPTKTQALLAGSIAINAGSDGLSAGLTSDQRGKTRFVGAIDIGAFETASVYKVVPLFDQKKAAKSGSTIPISIKLTDLLGNNIGASNLKVKAVSVVGPGGTLQSPGNSQPGNLFKFDPITRTYQFNLKTTGYKKGTFTFNFTIGDDPALQSLTVVIR